MCRLIRPYITRYDRETVLRCIEKNPHYDVEHIARETPLTPNIIVIILRQLQDEGIISDVET